MHRLIHLKDRLWTEGDVTPSPRSRAIPPAFEKLVSGLLAWAALLFLAFPAATVGAQEYSFRYLGIADGLNDLAVRNIYQDQRGFVWANTENGIYRYDGDRFEFFGAAQGVPLALDVSFGDAPDGSLLVGAEFGLYRLSGNRFSQVAGNFKSVSHTQGIEADGKGNTWLATDIGLVELSAQPGQSQFIQYLAPRAPGTSSP